MFPRDVPVKETDLVALSFDRISRRHVGLAQFPLGSRVSHMRLLTIVEHQTLAKAAANVMLLLLLQLHACIIWPPKTHMCTRTLDIHTHAHPVLTGLLPPAGVASDFIFESVTLLNPLATHLWTLLIRSWIDSSHCSLLFWFEIYSNRYLFDSFACPCTYRG